MATFLATSKMDPALIARIERSVGGTPRAERKQRVTARTKATVLRLVIAAAIVGIAGSVLLARRRYQQAVARGRAELLEKVRAQSAALSPEDRAFMSRVEPWLHGLAAGYEGDVTSDEIRTAKGFETTLARPSVYVRGATSAFANTTAIADTAAASTRDSFVFCLVDPPASRTEKAVLAKVRLAYAGGTSVEHVRRLHDAVDGLHRILLPWEARLDAAREIRDLDRITNELSYVHAIDAKRAVQADLLIAAMDEPGAPGPADLDGEKARDVRVLIVDIRAGKVLLRARKNVDPGWLTASTRATHAAGADGCALAHDIRSVVH
ncbi:MAG: hypothetical protein ABW133_20235 [Polyangiaceae bacterium]